MESIFHWLTIPECISWPAVLLIYTLLLHWKGWFFLPKYLSIANTFLARYGSLCPLLILHARVLSGLRSCAFFHMLREFLCGFTLCCMENVVSLKWSNNPWQANLSYTLFGFECISKYITIWFSQVYCTWIDAEERKKMKYQKGKTLSKAVLQESWRGICRNGFSECGRGNKSGYGWQQPEYFTSIHEIAKEYIWRWKIE